MLKVREHLLRAMRETAIGAISSKGRVTLPKGVRDALGVVPGDRIVFNVEGKRAIMRRVPWEGLAVLFSRQKPWRIRAVPYQRATRSEWASHRH